MIQYQRPANQLTAAEWTTIFQAADACVNSALNGFSAVLAQTNAVGPDQVPTFADQAMDRAFFFFNPITLPDNIHPQAMALLKNYFQLFNILQNGSNPSNYLFCREYDDTAIGAIISGLTPTATSSKYGVAIFNAPLVTSWLPTVYPLGFPADAPPGPTDYVALGIAQTPAGDTTRMAVNCLDVSLQVWTSSGLAVSFYNAIMAEHAQPFKPIDIFINSNFTWLTAWNKYSIVRIHNCATTATLATFGTVSKTLAPGASWCVRKVNGMWQSNGNYFHWMVSGDGRFL